MSRFIISFLSAFNKDIIINPFLRKFHETDPGSKKSAKQNGIFPQKSTKITRISYLKKNVKLLFKGHKYLPNR